MDLYRWYSPPINDIFSTSQVSCAWRYQETDQFCYFFRLLGTYCASKSAAHLLTQSIKTDLAEKGIRVIAVYPGYVNTGMSQDISHVEKESPQSIAISICEGIESGEANIFTDAMAKAYFKTYPVDVHILA